MHSQLLATTVKEFHTRAPRIQSYINQLESKDAEKEVSMLFFGLRLDIYKQIGILLPVFDFFETFPDDTLGASEEMSSAFRTNDSDIPGEGGTDLFNS